MAPGNEGTIRIGTLKASDRERSTTIVKVGEERKESCRMERGEECRKGERNRKARKVSQTKEADA